MWRRLPTRGRSACSRYRARCSRRGTRFARSNAFVIVEALALAALAVANALVGALHSGVRLVGGDCGRNPGRGLGARALRAVGSLPRRLPVGAVVAGTLVVGTAGAVAGAAVGAVGERRGGEGEQAAEGNHRVSVWWGVGNC